ncbi:O-antigen ligase family protein [Altererythrobacter arenosus]|uniref:O-antigen ligase family protein n=1 Tax=Altererythrobacter arenosus TaxID=3032592 RepID=A0ABY8FZG7_9SPHN|nr:O-antigen ligase family protein [Altererythrobacter sp. CAU 1644]WFL78711.1 O-antigen ligase family protein [Altererythrobacter sp. CAU 1644]
MQRITWALLFAAILATLAGGLGGSLQPSRLILAAALPLALLQPTIFRHLTPTAKQALVMVAAIVTGGVLSLAWTEDLAGGIGLLLAVLVGSLGFLAGNSWSTNPRSVQLLMRAWVIIVGISLPVALYEIATGNHFEGAFEDRTIGGIGSFPFAAIFFGNYNDFSAWLSLSFPITMAALALEKNPYLRFLIAGMNALVIAILVVNTSRGAIFIAIIGFAFFALKFQRVRIWLLLFVPVLIVMIIDQFGNEALDIYDLAVYRFESAGSQDESVSQRVGLLTAGLQALRDTYGFGVGVGGFEEYVNDNYPQLIPNPHNFLLEIAVNFGVIPALVFVRFFILTFLSVFRRKDMPEPVRVAVLFGVVTLPVIGAVPSHAAGYIYWWVWIATLVVMAEVRPVERMRQRSAPVNAMQMRTA